MICDECPLQGGCIEQRGLCRDYIRYMERVEEVRKKIEQLNTSHKKAAGRSGSDEGSVQEAGDLQQLEAHEGCRAPVPVPPSTDSSTEKEAGRAEEKEAGQNGIHTEAPEVDRRKDPEGD